METLSVGAGDLSAIARGLRAVVDSRLDRLCTGADTQLVGTPPEPDPPQTSSEPFALRGAIVALVAILLIAGVWPHILELLQWGRL